MTPSRPSTQRIEPEIPTVNGDVAGPATKPVANAVRRLFGTDGVRGVANVHPMTAEMALQLGRALAYLVRSGPHRRTSTPMEQMPAAMAVSSM